MNFWDDIMTVYAYIGKYGHGEESWHMIKRCLSNFCDLNYDFIIAKRETGKPFVKNPPSGMKLEFSVSNTLNIWTCAVSDRPCGLDIQERGSHRRTNWKAIAKRKYTSLEQKYVLKEGELGFYRLWVRKEALSKFTEEGIFKMDRSLVNKELKLKDYVLVNGRRAYFHDLDIQELGTDIELVGAICTPKKYIDLNYRNIYL